MPGFEVIGKEEKKEVNSIFDKGGVLFRQGFEKKRRGVYKVKQFEKEFRKKIKAQYSLAVTSGTAALRVALSVLDLKPNDEIITQSFTFVATLEAIVESNAKPVIAEIDETLNLDPNDLLKKINKKTKAVIVVHMLGAPAKLNLIKKICDKYKIHLIEDTAWGCGGSYLNKHLGTWGRIGTFSFDFAKTITTGEGGMLVFKKKSDFEKACAWHDHGHENNPRKPRWEDTRKFSGFNYRMTELQAAVGLAQLKKLKLIINSQRKNRNLIFKKISHIQEITFRNILKRSYDTADALIFRFSKKKLAIKFRKELLKFNIGTKILPEAYSWHFASTWSHFPALRKKYPKLKDSFPKSKKIIETCVSIPIFVFMNKKVPDNVLTCVKKTLSFK